MSDPGTFRGRRPFDAAFTTRDAVIVHVLWTVVAFVLPAVVVAIRSLSQIWSSYRNAQLTFTLNMAEREKLEFEWLIEGRDGQVTDEQIERIARALASQPPLPLPRLTVRRAKRKGRAKP